MTTPPNKILRVVCDSLVEAAITVDDHELNLVYDTIIKTYKRTLPFPAHLSAGYIRDLVTRLIKAGVRIRGFFDLNGVCQAFLITQGEAGLHIDPPEFVAHYFWVRPTVEPHSVEARDLQHLLALPKTGVYTIYIPGMAELLKYFSDGGAFKYKPKYANLV